MPDRCPDCRGAQFIHAIGADGATIQRSDTCSNHLTDAEAEHIHEVLCGCHHVDSVPLPDLESDAVSVGEG